MTEQSAAGLYFEVHGDRGPYLLLLHGMLSSRAQWRANLAALSEVCRPVVVELYAHGRSPAPDDDEPYRPENYLQALDDIRRRLGAESWLICGQSFGASLTLRYALEQPERVPAQIFTNSNSALADPDQVTAYRNTAQERMRSVLEGGHAGIEAIPVHPRHARRLPEDIKQEMVEDARRIDPSGLVRTFRNTSPYISVHDRVAGNTVPTLLVCGDKETRFLKSRDYAAATMPKLEVVNAEAGHAVNVQAADVFNSAVTDFIRRHT